MRMLSLVSGWYPHYFVMKKTTTQYQNTTLNGLMTDWG